MINILIWMLGGIALIIFGLVSLIIDPFIVLYNIFVCKKIPMKEINDAGNRVLLYIITGFGWMINAYREKYILDNLHELSNLDGSNREWGNIFNIVLKLYH